MKSLINLYCIVWSEETYEYANENGYSILDNRDSKNPDWYESWPIRNYLISNQLERNNFYGFLSPRFKAKTGLTHQDVINFSNLKIQQNTEIITFSPQPDQSAAFINVFEHANFYFPEFLDLAKKFITIAGLSNNLTERIMDSRNIVFSNYFIAKPRFWNRWLELFNILYEEANNTSGIIYELLNKSTNYPGSAQLKVFLAEQLASIILTSEEINSINYNTWLTATSATPFAKNMTDMVISDALKIAANDTGHPEYMEAYKLIRKNLMDKYF